MKVDVTHTKKQSKTRKDIFLPPVYDIHPGHDIVQGHQDFRLKKEDDHYLLILDLPEFHRRSMNSWKVNIKLLDLTHNLPFGLANTIPEKIVLFPDVRYKLTISFKNKNKEIGSSETIVVNFIPEK